ncbi:hypothetical protein DPMN_183631 [Dreissena polymorpha]|uniref:Uncharacterized protein n=1 Tax=Dreissena polymorpha TaxID=45954 RepID=A0A9D4I5M6_DREPO|nr:hypothetical protein DPMN_183631 [Dreissena polymorpha]
MIVCDRDPYTSTWPAGVTCTLVGSISAGSVKVVRTEPSLARVRSLLWDLFVMYNLSPVGLTAHAVTAKQSYITILKYTFSR